MSLIETRCAADPACGHCGSKAFQSWGNANGLKRIRCAIEDCDRTVNALIGTPLAKLRRRDAFLKDARALADSVSLRKAVARCNKHLEPSFRWRHRLLAVAKDHKSMSVVGIVEADETFIHKS